jgi:aspartyl-tRNA(Asn)/glutamyl-tRNA(Gln) amidotransferase subunit C
MAQISDQYAAGDPKRFDYVQREDALRPCLPHESAVQNAPDTDGTFFKVPKVIEK